MARDGIDRPDAPILIVGAGPAGLTTALLLDQLQVPSLIVERRDGVSPLPRATGVNVRTMEIFRQLGIAEEVRAKSPDSGGMNFMLVMDWLGGPILEELPYPSAIDPSVPGAPSPAGYQFCSQDVLEPILVGAVERSRHADISHGTELLDFEQDSRGVMVRLHKRSTGRTHRVRCEYLVGADGAGSRVRRSLGIAMRGHDHLTHDLNIVFEAELGGAIRGRKALLHRVLHPTLGDGIFRNLDGAGRRWTAFTTWFEEPTPERCAQVIRTYARDDDLDVRVSAVGEWVRATLLADRFHDGRVFLTGDAAHRVVPHGGLGMNTAIQSAHNLAWKLAGVIGGWADPRLLDTYEVERRDAGARTVELSYRLFSGPVRLSADVLGHVLGTAYEHGALVPDGSAPPAPANPAAEYIPVARPGHRAPHVWLDAGGVRRSTLDLFGRALVLLSAAEHWTAAARRVAVRVDVPLDAHLINDRGWARLYGVGERGAVLVRPDGYVAWRSTAAAGNPDDVVTALLHDIVGPLSRPRATERINMSEETTMTLTDANTPAMHARSGDVTIAYESAGVGDPTLMFIHGICADRSYFQPQVDRFARDAHVIAMDLRGHGASSSATTATIDDLAADVIAVAGDAGIERAVLCGHSGAATVALRVAAARPDLVRGIVMLDGVVLFHEPVRASGIMEFVPALATDHWLDALRGYFDGRILDADDPPELRQRVLGSLDHSDPALLQSFFASLFASDYANELANATCPLLYVHGRVPADLERLRALRPDATVEQTSGASHYMMLTAAGEVNAKLARFLTSLD